MARGYGGELNGAILLALPLTADNGLADSHVEESSPIFGMSRRYVPLYPDPDCRGLHNQGQCYPVTDRGHHLPNRLAAHSCFGVQNVRRALIERTQTTLRYVVRARVLQDVIEQYDEITHLLERSLIMLRLAGVFRLSAC